MVRHRLRPRTAGSRPRRHRRRHLWPPLAEQRAGGDGQSPRLPRGRLDPARVGSAWLRQDLRDLDLRPGAGRVGGARRRLRARRHRRSRARGLVPVRAAHRDRGDDHRPVAAPPRPLRARSGHGGHRRRGVDGRHPRPPPHRHTRRCRRRIVEADRRREAARRGRDRRVLQATRPARQGRRHRGRSSKATTVSRTRTTAPRSTSSATAWSSPRSPATTPTDTSTGPAPLSRRISRWSTTGPTRSPTAGSTP